MPIPHVDHALLPRRPRDTATTLTGNTSSAGAKAHSAQEEPVLPVPAWGEALRVWGGGWPVHIYGFSALFFIQVILASAILVRFRQRVRRLRPVLNTTCLLLLVGLLRFLYLVIDPYGSQGNVAKVLMGVLSQVVYPLLCAVYAMIQLLLLRLTRLDVGKSRLRSKSVLFGMTLTYMFCIVLAEVMAYYERRARLLLLLDHSFFMAWALYLCVSFICNGFRLSQYAAETQRVRKELNNFYSSRRSQTDMCMSRSSTSLRLSRPKLKITDEDQMTITIATDVDSSTSASGGDAGDKERARDKDRDKDRVRERDKFKDKTKEKEKEKGTKLRERDRGKLRDRDKERCKDGDMEKEKHEEKTEDPEGIKEKGKDKSKEKRRKYKKLSQFVRSSKCHEVVFDNSRLVKDDFLPVCLSEPADENDDKDDVYPLMDDTSPDSCICKSPTSEPSPMQQAFSVVASADSKPDKSRRAREKRRVGRRVYKACDNDSEEVFFRPVRKTTVRPNAEKGEGNCGREDEDGSQSSEEDRVKTFQMNMQKLPSGRDLHDAHFASALNTLPLLDFKSTTEIAHGEIKDSATKNQILCLFDGGVRKEVVHTNTGVSLGGTNSKNEEFTLLRSLPQGMSKEGSSRADSTVTDNNFFAHESHQKTPLPRENFSFWNSGISQASSGAKFGSRAAVGTSKMRDAFDVVSDSTDARSSSFSSSTQSSDGHHDSCDTTHSLESAAYTPDTSRGACVMAATKPEQNVLGNALERGSVAGAHLDSTHKPCETQRDLLQLEDACEVNGVHGASEVVRVETTASTAKVAEEDPWLALVETQMPSSQHKDGDFSAFCQSDLPQGDCQQTDALAASKALSDFLDFSFKPPEDDIRCDLCQSVEETADSRVPLLASVNVRLPGNQTSDPSFPCVLETGYLADTEVKTHQPRHSFDRRHRRFRQMTSQDIVDDISETDEVVGMTPSLSATFSATIRSQPSSIGLFRIRQSAMVQRAVQLTYALTFLLLFACLLQLYAAFGSYGVLAPSTHPDPWPWYAFQTLFRFTEAAIGFTSVGVVFIVLNHRNTRGRRKPPPRSAMLDCVV